MRNTINKKQFYKFVKGRGACRDGLKRLRNHMRTRTAREAIESYRRMTAFSLAERASDYKWLCNSLGLLSYELPDADKIISKINEWRSTWGKY